MAAVFRHGHFRRTAGDFRRASCALRHVAGELRRGEITFLVHILKSGGCRSTVRRWRKHLKILKSEAAAKPNGALIVCFKRQVIMFLPKSCLGFNDLTEA